VWAIDLTVGRVNGRLYAVWSGWERPAETDKTPQLLYIAPMDGPTRIAGPRRVLSAPTAPWERGPELDLQEGPEFLTRGDPEHGGNTFLVYSTRDSWLPTYELGMLRYRGGGADPTDSASWAKSAGPVFGPGNGVIGTGHNTFTVSPDGRQGWLVYHAKVGTEPGWRRDIHMQPFGWRSDGAPDFGAPVPNGAPVAAPSGECG
jgi:GH43 family beta-xylosidase